MALHVIDHPLIAHRLGVLRDGRTAPERFRQLTIELSSLIAYEASRNLPTEPGTVDGPLETAPVSRLAGPEPLVVPILRAGMGMLPGILSMIPYGEVAVIGLRRSEDTLEAAMYANGIPHDLGGRPVIVCDPMLATGGSLSLTCEIAEARGAGRVTALCLVAAPEGVERVLRDHPDVSLFVAHLDEHLDERGYIRPGLGDAGDRLYGRP